MQHMLTTIDNPFNPFEDFEDWMAFDHAMGYYSTEYLARIARTSPELGSTDQELAIEQAIDEIISENVLGIYKKVSKEYSDS